MKKQTRKLALRGETVRKLSSLDLDLVRGGDDALAPGSDPRACPHLALDPIKK